MKKEIDITELKQDDLNFNQGTAEGLALMERSMKRHKAGRSILIDKNGIIIAGNKTADAAKWAGINKVRIIESDGTELIAVKRTDIDLDSKEGRELALADNATASVNLSWNEENLEEAENRYDGFDIPEWGVDLSKNQPDIKSTGEIDVGTFSTDQTLSIKLTPEQYKKAVEKLQQIDKDLCEAFLKIIGYYG